MDACQFDLDNCIQTREGVLSKKGVLKKGIGEQLRPQNELKTFLLSVKGSSELEKIESKIQWMIKK